MNRWTWGMTAAAIVLLGTVLCAGAFENRIGAGAHYWRTIDEIEDSHEDIDDTGLSWLVTYQARLVSLLAIEADLEIFPDGFGGSTETTFAPQAYVVAGSVIYAALGIGINYADGEFANDPFYVVRAGLDLEILPSLHIDLNANYQFIDWEYVRDLDDHVDTDTITLGGAIRIAF